MNSQTRKQLRDASDLLQMLEHLLIGGPPGNNDAGRLPIAGMGLTLSQARGLVVSALSSSESAGREDTMLGENGSAPDGHEWRINSRSASRRETGGGVRPVRATGHEIGRQPSLADRIQPSPSVVTAQPGTLSPVRVGGGMVRELVGNPNLQTGRTDKQIRGDVSGAVDSSRPQAADIPRGQL